MIDDRCIDPHRNRNAHTGRIHIIRECVSGAPLGKKKISYGLIDLWLAAAAVAATRHILPSAKWNENQTQFPIKCGFIVANEVEMSCRQSEMRFGSEERKTTTIAWSKCLVCGIANATITKNERNYNKSTSRGWGMLACETPPKKKSDNSDSNTQSPKRQHFFLFFSV